MLQVGSPVKLRLIREIYSKNDVLLEKILHGMFEAERVRGEWFRLSTRIRVFLRHGLSDIEKFMSTFSQYADLATEWVSRRSSAKMAERHRLIAANVRAEKARHSQHSQHSP